MDKPLDLDAVQAFVLAADLQSFTRAAEALDSTQSAISFKLKKLEQRLGRRLLERTPRQVRLSAEGQQFLPAARGLLAAHDRALEQLDQGPVRFSVGISDHVAGATLPRALAQVHAVDPGVVVEVRVGSSHDLMPAYERGELDAVIVRREPQDKGGKLVMEERIGWFAHPDAQCWAGPALRVATFSSACRIRELSLRRLDAAGIPWVEVFVGGGILAVGAAVSAGLAVSALLHRSAPPGAVEVGERLGLPKLPLAQVRLHARLKEPRLQTALRTLVAALKSS
ncbi:LysR family transcriptional regulator [Herbaspirillum aquaticum]|jgi:DNA-binding transcriptional LysR family regulator|uniref:LysR family transcriptional regulator n=1 Tax=Herbaspirillum aquaticum TaxID=568783 RepID=A0A225T1G5_9BURK|nr:LysR family transcriptional regulator [Herbaspirillum aquaticum]OWY35902.1 LysR family transcriptional regulator [Herbaspirillum aquaticum]